MEQLIYVGSVPEAAGGIILSVRECTCPTCGSGWLPRRSVIRVATGTGIGTVTLSHVRPESIERNLALGA